MHSDLIAVNMKLTVTNYYLTLSAGMADLWSAVWLPSICTVRLVDNILDAVAALTDYLGCISYRRLLHSVLCAWPVCHCSLLITVYQGSMCGEISAVPDW